MAAGIRNTEADSLPLAEAKARLRIYIKDGDDQGWKDRRSRCCEKILQLVETEMSGACGVVELEKAIVNKNSETECILITPKTIDLIRFKILNKNCRPEFVSCRLWRWPTLLSATKIEPVAKYNTEDEFNHHMKSKYWKGQSICVNPYHYNCCGVTVDLDDDSNRNIKLRLLGQKKDGGDQLWKDRSIDCMCKVFDLIERKESRGLFELEKAIATENPETGCVLISASTDPRFYLRRQYYWPNIASYRLWRLPELEVTVTAIQPLEKYGGNEDNCHMKEKSNEYENVCVNPYHYTLKK